MTVQTDGNNLRQVASSSAFPGLTIFFSITEPAWTPGGRVSFIVRSGTAAQNGVWLDGARIVPEKFSTGQNWSPVGKQLVYGCSFRRNGLNQEVTDLCVFDAITGLIRQLPIDWPGRTAGGGLGFPKWTADGERIVFQMGYNGSGGSAFVEHFDIFSVDAFGGGLARLSDPGPEICPGESSSKSTYYWQTPSPAPDGTDIVAFRWTNVRIGTTGCSASTQQRGLYKISGSALQLVPDQAFGTDWGAIPVDLTINIDDGHGNPLAGLQVELKTTSGTVVNDNPETSGGSYFFDDVTPGPYVVRARLTDDAAAPAFDVRYPNSDLSLSNEAVWIDHRIEVPIGTGVLKKISFEQSASIVGSSIVAGDREYLDDLANLYFRVRQFVDWVKAHIEPDTGGLVPFHAFVNYDPIADDVFGANNAKYYGSVPMILIGSSLSNYSARDRADDEAPENAEWHEYVHHLYATHVDESVCAASYVNHAGYSNSDTCDSMSEGFAAFLPTWAARDITGDSGSSYDSMWDLEVNTRVWDLRTRSSDKSLVNAEDRAVAALFWDLADTNADTEPTDFIRADGLHASIAWADTMSVDVATLWSQLKAATTPTSFDFRKSFGTPSLTLDPDGDDVEDLAPVDQVFLMHGFFPIDADQLITPGHSGYHYDVNYPQRILPSAARNDSVGLTSHRAFSAAGVVSQTYIPRLHVQRLPSAYVALTVQDTSGTPISGARVELTVQSGAQQSTSNRRLDDGDGALAYVELSPYFDYLLPEDAPLPPCDPASNRRVEVTLRVDVNDFPSTSPPATFDNCAWLQAIDAATGPSAMSLTATFPEDATAPVSTIATSPTDALVGAATIGTWIVSLACSDPADSGFASGCARTEYRLDGGPVTTYQGRVTVEGLGTHTLEYRSIDAAANEEAFVAVTLEIAAGPPPVLSGFTPATGIVGVAVTITGAELGRTGEVKFNGVSAAFSVVSPTQVDATVPAGASTGPIEVTTVYGSASSTTSFVVIQPPTLSGFSPTFGPVGTAVVITGTDLDGTTGLSFNGISAAFVIDSPTRVTAVVPTGASTGPISLTTPAGTATSAASFSVTVGPAPSIASISPTSGAAGAAVTIRGANLATASSVTFNGTSASFRAKGSSLSATVPAGATSGPVAVTTPGGTATSAAPFTVPQPPTITGFSPDSGPPGSTVTLSGTDFTSVTAVKFNGSNSRFTVVSATTITATVPRGAKSGPIAVTTPGGTATSIASFAVTR